MRNKGINNIADYALIGNCRSAALVSKSGSIDWCCLPEFHSPSIFAALLDKEHGGFFVIQPISEYESGQQYLDKTNVVETIFTNSEGQVRILDCYVAMEENDKSKSLFPDHEILRVVECLLGSVKMCLEYFPMIGYGKSYTSLEDKGKLGIHFSINESTFILQHQLGEKHIKTEKEKAAGGFIINAGERLIFSLSCSTQAPAVIPEIQRTGWNRMEQTIAYWRNWISNCRYKGIHKEIVLRSALTLKLLTHAPSGAIIAAPTTSLPEAIGGERNWDYRYCWLRDASFTTRVLVKLGFQEEAHAYMNWILHATRLTRPRLQVVYTVYGDAGIKEKQCDWLTGYKNSKPVRIGNGAYNQFQLDVYGEVIDAVFTYSEIIESFDNSTRKFVVSLGKMISKLWDEPDEGIWETRSSKLHHTHSKVMAWVGLDRLIKLSRRYNWKVPLSHFEATANKIKKAIEEKGFNQSLDCYTREFDGHTVDAALLILPLVEYCKADSPRMLTTRKRISDELSEDGFMYRYKTEDGLKGGEGSFILCSFWNIENLAKGGYVDEAMQLLDKIVSHLPPTGLISEEIDPFNKELLGNFPQGFSHIGLINATLTVNEMNQNKGSFHAHN
jgi:GH15 family glucan-1,4-alpha-glucosidase